MSWDDQSFAARFRDLIVQVSEGVVDRMRPEERLGKVYSFDPFTRTAQVLFAGETVANLQPVQMSSNQMPSTTMDTTFATLAYDAPGDIIRVGGKGKLYCVSFVSGNPINMGYSVPIGGIVYYPLGTVPASLGDSPGWVQCAGQTLDSVADARYARLYSVILNKYGGTDGTNFKVPLIGGMREDVNNVALAFSMNSGWTAGVLNGSRSGNVVNISGGCDRASSTLSGGTTGNITNNPVMDITDPAWRPLTTTGMTIGGSGQMNQLYVGSGGTITISAMLPNSSIAVGEGISFTGTYCIPSPTDSIAMMKL